MKYNELKYVQAFMTHAATVIDFDAADEFCRYAETIHAKIFFRLTEKETDLIYFAILQDNVLLRLLTKDYQNLYDYLRGEKNGFPSATVFYEATTEGYIKYDEYKMVKEAGIASHDIFEKVRSKGFLIGFVEFNKLLAVENTLPQLPSFTNPYELYLFAEQNSFENFSALKVALLAGFTNADAAKAASERGFTSNQDYDEAIAKGFSSFVELEASRKYGVRDRVDYIRYLDLQKVESESMAHDKKLLLVLLSKIEQGKKISINKLIELHGKSKEEYWYPEKCELPQWFSVSLNSHESYIEFLAKGGQTVKYGEYDTDGEFFQINRMQDRKVVIDGSNVAHNSQSKGLKPRAENLIKLVSFLKEKGFTDISIFVDASLYHKLEDKENLPKVKEMAAYQEAPAETSADMFIIQYVKSQHCLLVSNDTFREWKIQDPWVAENIDYYRLSFMIKGDEVLMPDLK